MSRQYQPIDCNFYDRLEAWATLKQSVNIVFQQGAENQQVKGVIEKLFIRGGAEFMRLDNGLEIRLDKLVEVEGIEVPKTC
jgi:Rho-binding antiterminator